MGLNFITQQDYYFTDGNVSIGRSSAPPETELDVTGTVKMTGLRLGTLNAQAGKVLVCLEQTGEADWQDPSGFMQGLWSENANHDIYRMSSVGIGTDTPQEKLDVNGNITLADAIIGKESKSLWNDPDYLTIKGSESERAAKIMIPKGFSEENNALKIINPGSEGGIQFSNEGIINLNVRKDDIVIGRPDHEMEVKVNGKIWSYEVEVQLTDWWDEVFSTEYQLMPLNELENYIATNRHLPEIPTEKEVMENGIKLGEMNALLLKKIEELTLYVIELKKELDEVKQQETQTK
ncbi:MAG: hypothetical protein KQH67_07250 [Bacteroidetes bacterium]|nr:hypothetical protein [Bacteroidota bacterium]